MFKHLFTEGGATHEIWTGSFQFFIGQFEIDSKTSEDNPTRKSCCTVA